MHSMSKTSRTSLNIDEDIKQSTRCKTKYSGIWKPITIWYIKNKSRSG
jgi:hypothetical protein